MSQSFHYRSHGTICDGIFCLIRGQYNHFLTIILGVLKPFIQLVIKTMTEIGKQSYALPDVRKKHIMVSLFELLLIRIELF